ncbi:hypothetical protein OH76DRAFT_134599 [Lentinus brumalis]|uniref:Uncharacterized protein n=1 Tax=Lentinus brumalis TaxID=2498619 RepID=A0A371DK51_9APHY|nr:hypothetical protein OH76DRAFT_134599 [Polyporus brumalis]
MACLSLRHPAFDRVAAGFRSLAKVASISPLRTLLLASHNPSCSQCHIYRFTPHSLTLCRVLRFPFPFLPSKPNGFRRLRLTPTDLPWPPNISQFPSHVGSARTLTTSPRYLGPHHFVCFFSISILPHHLPFSFSFSFPFPFPVSISHIHITHHGSCHLSSAPGIDVYMYIRYNPCSPSPSSKFQVCGLLLRSPFPVPRSPLPSHGHSAHPAYTPTHPYTTQIYAYIDDRWAFPYRFITLTIHHLRFPASPVRFSHPRLPMPSRPCPCLGGTAS